MTNKKLVNFSKFKDKTIKILKKENYYYQLYNMSEVNDLLSLFKIDYRLEGNHLLVIKIYPFNAYEIYFRDSIPIGSFKYFIDRTKKLKDINIKILIIHNFIGNFLKECLPEVFSMDITSFFKEVKETNLINLFKQTSCIDTDSKV